MKNKLKDWLDGRGKQNSNEQTQAAIWGNIADMFSQVASDNLEPLPTLQFQHENKPDQSEIQDLQQVLQVANSYNTSRMKGFEEQSKLDIYSLVTMGILYVYNNKSYESDKDLLAEILMRRKDYETTVSYYTQKRHGRQLNQREKKRNN